MTRSHEKKKVYNEFPENISMSQLPDMNERYQEMWDQVRWYHIPVILFSMFILMPICMLFAEAIYLLGDLKEKLWGKRKK